MADSRTVAWKDIREMLLRRGSVRRGAFGPILSAVVFGVLLGLQDRAGVPIIAFLPGIIVASVVADGFAGERERHTLETLLATPASDRALLVGKIGAYVGYGWAVCLVCIAVGAVVAAVNPRGVYPAGIMAFDFVFTLVVCALTASLGVVVSLKAETVRAAARTLGLLNMPLVVLAAVVRVFAVDRSLAAGLTGTAMLAIAAVVLLGVSEARFRRGRLLLD